MRLAALLAAVLLAACHSAPKPTLIGWRPIVTFSGHGDSQTESFNIETGQWRIKWTTSNENPSGSGTFRVTVHSAISGRPLLVAVEHKGVGKGVAQVTEDPRLYHLVIDSAGVDWTVSVEEASVSYGARLAYSK